MSTPTFLIELLRTESKDNDALENIANTTFAVLTAQDIPLFVDMYCTNQALKRIIYSRLGSSYKPYKQKRVEQNNQQQTVLMPSLPPPPSLPQQALRSVEDIGLEASIVEILASGPLTQKEIVQCLKRNCGYKGYTTVVQRTLGELETAERVIKDGFKYTLNNTL